MVERRLIFNSVANVINMKPINVKHVPQQINVLARLQYYYDILLTVDGRWLRKLIIYLTNRKSVRVESREYDIVLSEQTRELGILMSSHIRFMYES